MVCGIDKDLVIMALVGGPVAAIMVMMVVGVVYEFVQMARGRGL